MSAQKHPTARPAHIDPKLLRLMPNVRIAGAEAEDQEEFEASIATHGVQSPLSVRTSPIDGAIEVIFGQRRLAAALKAGLSSVPIHWSDMADEAIRTAQLTENLQRSSMHPLDIAAAVWDIYNNEAGGSATLVAEMLNKPKSWVSKMMKLGADLPDYANTVARGLMLSNALTDADMAYTLCQIEAISLADAKRIGGEIAGFIKAHNWLESATAAFEVIPTTDEAARAKGQANMEAARAELAKNTQHTRSTLRNALKQLQAAAEGTPTAEGASTEGNGADSSGDDATPAATPAYKAEAEDWQMLAHILESATVPAKWLARLAAMRAHVAAKLAE